MPSGSTRGSAAAGRREGGPRRKTPLTIEGELIAKSTGAPSLFSVGERVFHQKFGNGNVVAVDGNKLTIRFDKAGKSGWWIVSWRGCEGYDAAVRRCAGISATTICCVDSCQK